VHGKKGAATRNVLGSYAKGELSKNLSAATVAKVSGHGSNRKTVILILQVVSFFDPIKGTR
jgi:hypothetical protein